jgi:hypothetical protein
VLATRIMRAHDNPSPPPESPRCGSTDPDYHRSITPSHSPLLLPDDVTAVNQELILSVHPSPLATDSHEMERSLLFFDSPLTPSITPSPPTSSSHLPLPINHPSVDHLLSLSPSPEHPSAYNIPSRSTSLCLPMPDLEQSKEDKPLRPFEENPEVTCTTTSESITSGIGDTTLSLEGRSAGFPRLRSSLVFLIDDRSTESLQEATMRENTIDNQGKVASCTDDAENSPRNWKEDCAIQEGYPLDANASKCDGTGGPMTERSTRDTRSANRELGSLSPSSANLLTHLLSSPPKFVSGPALDITQNLDPVVPAIVDESDSPPPTQPPLRLPELPKTPTPPIRFSSPTRSRGPQSPAKSRLQSAALDDPQRTPARRILIEEAIAQGHISPKKGPSLAGRIPVFKIPPTDSPARRVNVNQAPAPWQGLRFGSPTRTTSPAVLRTAESHLSRMSSYASQIMRESSTKSRTAGSSSAAAWSKPRPLPFPIVALGTVPSQSTLESKSTMGDAADVRMSSPVKSDSPPMSSPAKSSLKQTTSRIPRGIKPYARPDRQDKSTSATVSLAEARAKVCFNIDPLNFLPYMILLPAEVDQGIHEERNQF